MIKKLGKTFRAKVQNMTEKEAGEFLVGVASFVLVIVFMPTLIAHL